jgi:hypothetical protein
MSESVEDTSGELWWCNAHRRRATHIRTSWRGELEHCCSPNLGGITLPCRCANLTDEVEIVCQDE